MRAFIFKNRGLLLSLPAIALAARGKPSSGSIALGLPIAIGGELIRCWAVGYSGETTRNDVVTARKLVTAGPYAYVRNPLYIGNFVTATGFAIAFTGRNCPFMRTLLVSGSLAAMIAVYAAIVPHEEAFLRSEFPDEFERYCERVPRVIPRSTPIDGAQGEWRAEVVRTAESKTFVTFGAMLLALWLKARKTPVMAPSSVARRLRFALLATALVAVLEFWGGATSHSLALTGDAVHVCMDVVALALALVAAVNAARPADPRRTFGYGRIEVLGALVNGTILLVATLAIVYFAVRRFAAPVEPQAGVMTMVAAAGLAVNAAVGFSLRAPGKRDMNVRAALFHVFGDAIGAMAVIAGGIAIGLTHLAWIDPLLSLFVAAIIVVGVVRLMRDATDVLLESVPSDVSSADLVAHLEKIGGVTGVHDLHVWSIGSGSHALSAHVLLDDRRLSEATDVLREIDDCAREHFGITHVTVQFECETCPVVVRH